MILCHQNGAAQGTVVLVFVRTAAGRDFGRLRFRADEGHVYHRASAGFAFHGDGAAHDVHDALHYGKAETGALLRQKRAGSRVFPGEGIEHHFLEILAHAHAVIFYLEIAAYFAAGQPCAAGGAYYGAAGRGIFHGA